MSYDFEFKASVLKLRKRGYSIKEISEKVGAAKSTISLIVRSVPLNAKALHRLKRRRILGQYKTVITKRAKAIAHEVSLRDTAQKELSLVNFDKTVKKLLCSILFWTEGGRQATGCVTFMNSDPEMVEVFLKLLRSAFEIDERKLRGLLHLHFYHKDETLKTFWSKLTHIPVSQFTKTYQKQNTEKRKRLGYMGCIKIRYYDVRVARELKAYYNVLSGMI